MKEKLKSKFLYAKIVADISKQILESVYKGGDKLPPLRKLSSDLDISVSTILQAYIELENLGLVESKIGSGYYVKPRIFKSLPEPEILTLETAIKTYKGDELASNIHELASIQKLVSLGAGVPSSDIIEVNKLNKILISIARKNKDAGILYEFPPGNYKLRREIAKRTGSWEYSLNPEEIVITNGATEAITLALLSIAKPGDTIITESPTFYLLLQIIQKLGLKILELPTHPRNGIEVNILERVVKEHNISGCLLYPTINSPLGAVIPEKNKIQIYDILSSKNIPIIEGDVWGDLYFDQPRPKPIKSIDKNKSVIYFSSFTKTGIPGYRIGYASTGKYYKKFKDLKYMLSVASPNITQAVVAEYLRSGGYEKGLTNLRRIYSSRLTLFLQLITEYFPQGTKVSKPQGGAFLWVELPKEINSISLQEMALKENISIAPGPLFSTTNNFSNYIRLSCACPWEVNEIENAMKKLGYLCKGY